MVWSRITLEEYLRSIEHETPAEKDVSLDDFDMVPDLEEENVKVDKGHGFESRISIDVNLLLLASLKILMMIKEVLIISSGALNTHVAI